MFVALGMDGNRLYADSVEKGAECFCPACGEKLRLRKGPVNQPHFAHRAKTECRFGQEKDYKSEWHIRMQEYFPLECREVRFIDDVNGEVHIADVFLKEENTVLEFQKSSISGEEFLSRTNFHLREGRRLVWLFDESSTDPGSQFGRFKQEKYWHGIVPQREYQWMRRPRKCLDKIPDLKAVGKVLSICVYFGTEGDIFHRIIHQFFDYTYVRFSPNTHSMCQSSNMNIDGFFAYDVVWEMEDYAAEESKKLQEERRRQQLNAFFRSIR